MEFVELKVSGRREWRIWTWADYADSRFRQTVAVQIMRRPASRTIDWHERRGASPVVGSGMWRVSLWVAEVHRFGRSFSALRKQAISYRSLGSSISPLMVLTLRMIVPSSMIIWRRTSRIGGSPVLSPISVAVSPLNVILLLTCPPLLVGRDNRIIRS